MRHGIPVGTERLDAGRTCACKNDDSVCSEPQAGPCASRAHVGHSTLSLGKLRPKDEETASRAHGQRTTHEREVESKSIERAPPFGDLSAEQDPRGFSHPGLKPRPLGSPRRSPQEVADVRGAIEGATLEAVPRKGGTRALPGSPSVPAARGAFGGRPREPLKGSDSESRGAAAAFSRASVPHGCLCPTFVWLCPCRFFPRNRPQEAARSQLLQHQTRV